MTTAAAARNACSSVMPARSERKTRPTGDYSKLLRVASVCRLRFLISVHGTRSPSRDPSSQAPRDDGRAGRTIFPNVRIRCRVFPRETTLSDLLTNPLILLAVLAGAILLIAFVRRALSGGEGRLPYYSRKFLLSKGEMAFYRVLV